MPFVIDDLIIALVIIAVIATVASAITAGIQAEEAADAQSKAYKARSKALSKKGYADEARLRRLKQIRLRKMEEQVGISGVRGDVGTPVDLFLDTAAQFNKDELNARLNGIFASEEANAAGKNFGRAGKLGVAGAAIGGVSGAASSTVLGAGALS